MGIYLDSMRGERHDILKLIHKYLEDEHKLRLKSPLEEGWEMESLSSKIPQQDNGSDCGVFSCKFAEYIARGFPNPRDFNFTCDNMQNFRRLICHSISQGEIIDT